MPNMVSIQFPGSNTVYYVEDATARSLLVTLQAAMGNLGSLDTQAKTSLVDAINELAADDGLPAGGTQGQVLRQGTNGPEWSDGLTDLEDDVSDLGNPIKALSISDGVITITYADDTTGTLTLPAGLAFDGGYIDPTDGALHLTMDDEDIDGFTPIPMPVSGPSDVDYDANHYFHFYDEEGAEMYGGPFLIEGGSGGGGSTISVTNVVKPTTVRNGADAVFSFTATSSDDTDITVNWKVNGNSVRITTGISGATQTFNAKDYLLASSANTVRAEISSEGGGTLARSWVVTCTAFSIAWGAAISPIMLYTTEQNVFAVIDVTAQGRTANTLTVTVGENEREQTVTGSRTVTVEIPAGWFTTGANTVTASLVNGEDETDRADDISFVVIWGVGAEDPIVAFARSSVTGMQYDTIPILYYVYDPESETATAEIGIGSETPREVTVGREIQTYRFIPQTDDDVTVTLACGEESTTMTVTVDTNPYNIGIVTGDNLRYNLDPNGHSNSDADRSSFAGLTFSAGFDWANGGFQQDADGATALVIKKGHRATLPRSIFADADANGKTLDISFRVVNSDQYDAVAMQDLNNGGTIGLVLRANEGELRLNNATGQIFRYCEESRIDLSVLVEDVVAQRVSTIWLDGIPSKVDKYQAGMLVQSENDMVIGSDHCDVWVYAIRCYNSKLFDMDMIQNYVASGSTTADKVARAIANDVFDSNQKITPATLHAAAPELTIIEIAAERMTVNKKDPVPADVTITDGSTVLTLPKATSASSNDGTVFKVQGTSSAAYGRSALNMDIDFKNTNKSYKISEASIAVKYLNIKVNVASSENANNICCVDWYNQHQPFIIEARQDNPAIRDTVEGKPCAVFFRNTGSQGVWVSSQFVQPNETILYVLGDICNSKKNTAVFGQDGTGEHYTKACIEVSGNDTACQRFESAAAVYNAEDGEWQTTATVNGETKVTTEYEWRMEPSNADLDDVVDAWDDLVAWVVSTIGNAAKFKAEAGSWFSMDSLLYHFLMIEFFAAYDNVSKNTFFSYDYDEDAEGYRWNITKAYDWDTVIACDNDGVPFGDYGIDYGDTVSGRSYFNAVTNTIWANIKTAYQAELSALYITLRGQGAWNSGSIIAKWDNYQAKRPHAAMVKDAYIKYILPYKTTGVVIDTSTYSYDDNYLGRMNGSKTYQRRQFFTYQTDYMDGKYGYYSKNNSMQFRTNGAAGTKDFTIKAYAKTYITMIADNNTVGSRKVQAGGTVTFSGVSVGSNTTLYVTPDRLVQYVRPLNETQNSTFAASGAAKLMEAILGSENENTAWASGTSISVPSAILKALNIRNLVNFSAALDLASNTELEELDTRGTNAGVITLAPYAPITSLLLNACSGLVLRHLTDVETFSMPDGESLVSVWAEDCGSEINDALPELLLDAFESGSAATRSARLVGVDWELEDTDLLNYLLTARAIDAAGNMGSAPCVLSGHVTVPVVRTTELARYEAAWPGVVDSIAPPIVQYAVTFLNWDGSPVLDPGGQPYVQYVDAAGSAYDPILAGEVSAPARAADAHYTYAFDGWDNLPTGVLSPCTVTATYTSTARTYTVEWYDGIGGTGTLLERRTGVAYGSCLQPTDNAPTYTDLEGSGIYYVFDGWDASTGYITGDTVVKARWIVGNLPSTSAGIPLSEMTMAQIAAVAKNKMASTYWNPKDHFDVVLGRDFHFSNIQDMVLVDEPVYFNGTTAPIIFNGENDNPLIQLFNGSVDAFTIALDYEFTSDSGALLSCFDSNGNQGFTLRRNGNYVNLLWGDSNINVGYAYQRGMVTIRFNGDNAPQVLFVGYDGILGSSYNYATDANSLDTNCAETPKARSTATETNAPLTIGGVGYMNGTDVSAQRATGWVHWCKIWYGDLGTYDAKATANFCRLTQRFNYAPIQYRDGLDSPNTLAGMFLSEGPLPYAKVMNRTNTNAGGWKDSNLREWLNGQYYDALPIAVQSILKPARVRASKGSQSTEIDSVMDKVYLPAYAEVFSGQTNVTYLDELDDQQHTIPWFVADSSKGLTANHSRVKFLGAILPDDVTIIVDSADPTIYPSGTHDIRSGKTVWINTSNSSYGYIYLDADYISKHKVACGRLVTASDNISAQGSDSDGHTGGKWVRAWTWWERSPNLTSSTNFWTTNTGGSTFYTSANYAYGLVCGFSV